MLNENNKHFTQSSIPAKEDAMHMLYERIWEKVAEKAVGEMAKQQVRREVTKACEDIVHFTFDKEITFEKIAPEDEVKSFPRDQWANFIIHVDEKPFSQKPENIKTLTNAQSESYRRTNTNKQGIQNKSFKQEVFIRLQPQQIPEPEEERLRYAYLTQQRIKLHTKLSKAKRQSEEKARLQSRQKNKLQITNKPVTFDYNGVVLNFGKLGGSKKPLFSTMNLKINKEGVVTKKVHSKVATENISRYSSPPSRKQKTENQGRPDFQINAQTDLMQDGSIIEDGVRIIQIKGKQQIVKQNLDRPKQTKGYLNYHIREFKDYIKDRKFKEHALKLRNIDSKEKIVRYHTENIIPQSNSKKDIANAQQRQTSIGKFKNISLKLEKNAPRTQILLPELSSSQNKRSQIYFEEIKKDKNKSRVKTLKFDNSSGHSSFYYKNAHRSYTQKKEFSTHSNTISVNEPVYQKVFDSIQI